MSAPVARTNRPVAAPRPGTTPTTREQLDELDALLQRMLQLPVSESDPEPPPREPQPQPQPAPPRPARPAPPPKRAYPPSYVVVESSIPSYLEQPPANLEPRRIEHQDEPPFEPPTPGGRHDLVEDTPDDPIADLAQLRARLDNQECDWVPLRSSWQPSAQTWKPLAETWQQTVRTPEPASAPPDPPRPIDPPPVFPPTPEPPAVTVRQETPTPQPVIPPAPPAPVERPALPTRQRRPLVLMPVVWFNLTFDLFLWPLGPLGTWLKGRSGRGFLGTVGFLCLLGAAALALADGLGWTR